MSWVPVTWTHKNSLSCIHLWYVYIFHVILCHLCWEVFPSYWITTSSCPKSSENPSIKFTQDVWKPSRKEKWLRSPGPALGMFWMNPVHCLGSIYCFIKNENCALVIALPPLVLPQIHATTFLGWKHPSHLNNQQQAKFSLRIWEQPGLGLTSTTRPQNASHPCIHMRPLPLQLVQLIFPGYVPLTKQESPKKSH